MTTTQLSTPASDGEVPAIESVVDVSDVAKNGVYVNGLDAFTDAPAPPTVNDTHEYSDPYAIPLHDQLAFTPRKLRVITAGAGFSGLMLAHKFQHRFPEVQAFLEHKIFEARNDIGGTWLVNTYPGVQCDVPSHIYVSRKPVQL